MELEEEQTGPYADRFYSLYRRDLMAVLRSMVQTLTWDQIVLAPGGQHDERFGKMFWSPMDGAVWRDLSERKMAVSAEGLDIVLLNIGSFFLFPS